MERYSFNRKHVAGPFDIKFNAPFPEGDTILVESEISGKVLKFFYDAQMTENECMKHEGWDGEERHKYYVEPEKMIIVEFWNTPYDGRF